MDIQSSYTLGEALNHLRCPLCGAGLGRQQSASSVTCHSCGQQFLARGDRLRLLDTEAMERWDRFEGDIRHHRRGEQAPDWTADLALLPASAARTDKQWARRLRDWRFLRRLLRQRDLSGCDVLEVGAYNGWLSHRLSAEGHRVIALHHFGDQQFGLEAVGSYPRTWPAIQCDLLRPELIEGEFQVVLINHGLHFWPHPIDVVRGWQQKLAPGGLMVLLGLSIWRDPSARIKDLDAMRMRAQDRGQQLFPLDGPGYLGPDDRAALLELGFDLRAEWAAWRPNLLALLWPKQAQQLRATYSGSCSE